MARKIKILFFIILFIFILAVALFVAGSLENKTAEKEGYFVIKRGDNVLQVSANLENQGFISGRISFIWKILISGNIKKIKSGRYQIEKGESFEDLIKEFTEYHPAPVTVSVAPGKTTKNIASILESTRLFNANDFLNLTLNPGQEIVSKFSFLRDNPKESGLEGFLFPDTYVMDSSESARDVILQMLNNFDSKLASDTREEIKKRSRTIFQEITMASILEKEVKDFKDKQIVAGILWKRADNNLPLEADSTLLYFLTSEHPSVMEKSIDSPYNTYKYAGLPKGPICNPGLDSIKAAISPEETDYWFYLSASDGKTIFSKNLGEHLINKAKYLNTN